MRHFLTVAKRDGNGSGELPEREGKTEEISPEVLEVIMPGEVEAGLLGIVGKAILDWRRLRRAKRNIITSVVDSHREDLGRKASMIKLASREDKVFSSVSPPVFDSIYRWNEHDDLETPRI